jgi:four helix bundle protein
MASYYRQLEAWKRAYELNKTLHNTLKKFPKEEQFALTDQIRRAWLSIISNIAEWHGRSGNAEYNHFMNMARWSAMEIETQILLAKDFWYIPENEEQEIQNLISEIIRMLYGMIKK